MTWLYLRSGFSLPLRISLWSEKTMDEKSGMAAATTAAGGAWQWHLGSGLGTPFAETGSAGLGTMSTSDLCGRASAGRLGARAAPVGEWLNEPDHALQSVGYGNPGWAVGKGVALGHPLPVVAMGSIPHIYRHASFSLRATPPSLPRQGKTRRFFRMSRLSQFQQKLSRLIKPSCVSFALTNR
jgi:hypothetical protein